VSVSFIYLFIYSILPVDKNWFLAGEYLQVSTNCSAGGWTWFRGQDTLFVTRSLEEKN